MKNLTLSSSGAILSFASCDHPAHPAGAIIDGKPDSFWLTTGLFPHDVVVSFPAAVTLESIETHSGDVKGLQIEVSTSASPENFSVVSTVTLPESTAGHRQVHQHKLTKTAGGVRHLRLVLQSSHNADFVGVYQLIAQGSAT